MFHTTAAGDVSVQAFLSPTLPYDGSDGFRYGISVNDGPVQVVNMHDGMK
ncbi:MAG: hypothetical protein ACOCTG_02980, partial [Bacteroidota bacterium]